MFAQRNSITNGVRIILFIFWGLAVVGGPVWLAFQTKIYVRAIICLGRDEKKERDRK